MTRISRREWWLLLFLIVFGLLACLAFPSPDPLTSPRAVNAR